MVLKGVVAMDTEKLVKDLMNREELKDIPLMHIGQVALVLLELLQGNNYIYKIGE